MQVIVNAAMSVDGKLSTSCREQIRISGPEDFDRVDRLRAEVDAVMIGIGTVIADDPRLLIDSQKRRTERITAGKPANPTRIVVDSTARLAESARILAGDAETILLVGSNAPPERMSRLEDRGARVIQTEGDRVNLRSGMDRLTEFGIDRVLVEGGGELLFSLFAAKLVDSMTVYIGSIIIGGRDAPTLIDGVGFTESIDFPNLDLVDINRLDAGVVLTYQINT